MANKWMYVLSNDLKQYKSNLLLKKISRGIFIIFILGVLIPRDVQSFFRLLSNTSDALLITSQLSSLFSIIVFNSVLLFSYLIQVKILPIAYNTNYMPSIFDRLSISIARAVFFTITNWFVLVWVLTGLLLSSTDIALVIILKILFITLNIPVTLSLMHEKKYVLLPILFGQLVIYSYLSNVIFISVLNILLQIFVLSKIYDTGISTNKIKFFRFVKNTLTPKIFHSFIFGPQTLRVGIMLRGNLQASVGIVCTLAFLYGIFYHSLLSTKGESTRILYLYTSSVLYLLSYIYAKLNLERSKFSNFLTSISPRSSEVIHDFVFTLIVFELVQIFSLYFFPIALEWFQFVPLILFPIPVLAICCFLSTINNRYRKVYLFLSFVLIVWLIIWNF